MSDYAGVSIGVRVGLKTLLAQMTHDVVTRVVEFLESSAVGEVDYEEFFRQALYKALEDKRFWDPLVFDVGIARSYFADVPDVTLLNPVETVASVYQRTYETHCGGSCELDFERFDQLATQVRQEFAWLEGARVVLIVNKR